MGLAGKIKEQMGIEPELIPGGGGIFDIEVEQDLVYSKFKTGTFPDEDQLVSDLASTYGGK